MKILFSVITVVIGLLYLGQLISVVNIELAQKLGLQEDPAKADPLSACLEIWTARWDLVWLWPLAVAGALMLTNHPWWPYVALVGGGATVDAGGREAAKVLGLKERGVSIGTASEQRIIAITLVTLIVLGGLAIAAALIELT